MTDEEKLLWMFEQVHAEKDALYRTIKKLRDENEEHLHAIETWKDEVKILECECNAAKQKVSVIQSVVDAAEVYVDRIRMNFGEDEIIILADYQKNLYYALKTLKELE